MQTLIIVLGAVLVALIAAGFGMFVIKNRRPAATAPLAASTPLPASALLPASAPLAASTPPPAQESETAQSASSEVAED